MKNKTTKLTIRVPRDHLDAAKQYARRHGITLTEVIDRYLRTLQGSLAEPSEQIAAISRLVPRHVDAAAEYRDHLIAKHTH